MSNPSTPARSKKRQSCDRCHGQKLRCIRSNDGEDGVCNRCLRQGAQCVYSSSLPKGRPIIQPSVNATALPAISIPITSATPGPRYRRQSSQSNANDITLSEDLHSVGQMNTPSSTNTNTPLDSVIWPLSESLEWNDMPYARSGQDSIQWAPTNIEPAAFPSPFSDLASYAPVRSNESIAGLETLPQLPSQLSADDDSPRGAVSGDDNIKEEYSPGVGIARLSLLSTRLHPLYHSCCMLAEAAGSSASQSKETRGVQNTPLIDDTAFKSVTAWLSHVSTNMDSLSGTEHPSPASQATSTGNTLHGAFSASHHLMEILRGEQAETSKSLSLSTPIMPTSTPTSVTGSHGELWASGTPDVMRTIYAADRGTASVERHTSSSSFAQSSSHYSNSVVRHLVIACHTLLLNIYVAVLIALQYDADHRSSHYPVDGENLSKSKGAAALADIRLVTAVQVCSYLLERQNRAVDLYLSTQSFLPPGQQPSTSDLSPPSPSTPTMTNRGAINDLKKEVEQRLIRLRKTLSIQT